MARYQLLRPSPVIVTRDRIRRQAPAEPAQSGASSPKSPASPGSTGGVSSGSDSDSESEDEPHSPKGSGTTIAISAAPAPPTAPAISSAVAAPTAAPAITSVAKNTANAPNPTPIVVPPPASPPPANSKTSSAASARVSAQQPPFTQNPTLGGINAGPPQVTQSTSQETPSPSPTSTTFASSFATSTRPTRPTISAPIASQISPPGSSSVSAPSSRVPRPEEPIMSRTAAVAATVLGVLGALALIIGAVIYIKHRKRKRARYNQPVSDNAFNPDNTGSLHTPETAHIDSALGVHNNSHMTRSTTRSNTLFGAAPYSRPETVSTERSLPTPNPFADPPLNKAYDVLAGRPRSTTLTDRGSWIKNPFRDPESERFDPFGELQEKARRERVRYVEEARREKEMEVVRGYEEKERMGLQVPQRKGSGVTIEGIGVLDRSGESVYR